MKQYLVILIRPGMEGAHEIFNQTHSFPSGLEHSDVYTAADIFADSATSAEAKAREKFPRHTVYNVDWD